MRARSLVAAVATAAAMTGGVALAAPAQADAQSSATLATLATLPVKGRAPKTGYDRSLFGDSWTDDVTVTDVIMAATPVTTSSGVTSSRSKSNPDRMAARY